MIACSKSCVVDLALLNLANIRKPLLGYRSERCLSETLTREKNSPK